MLLALQALLFLAPLIFLPRLFEPANLPQTVFVQVFAWALLSIALATGVRVPAPWRVAPAGLPSSLLVAFGVLSLFWAHTFREAWPEALRWVSIAIVFSLAAAFAGAREDAAPRMLGAIFAGGALVTVLGLLQFYFRVDWVPQAFPPAGTFMNRNVAVSFVVAVWPLGLALVGRGRAVSSWAVAIACALMGAFVFHTFTKSGWLAAAVQVALAAAAAFFIDSLPPPATRSPGAPLDPHAARARVLGPGLAAFFVLVVLVQLTPDGLRPRWWEARDAVAFTLTAPVTGPDLPLEELSPGDRANSIRSRRAIWSNTLVMVREHPVHGVGLGNHKVHYPRYARSAAVDPAFGPAQLDYVHNDPLQLLAELGLVGFLLGAWTLAAAAKGLWRLQQSHRDPSFVLALAVSLVGVLVDALFNFPFQRALPPVIVAVELGVLGGLLQVSLPPPLVRPRVPGLLAAAASLAVVALQARIVAADHHVLLAREAEARRDWGTAEVASVRALRNDPRRREALFVRGRALLEQGDARTASVVLQRLLAAYPYDVAALGNLAAAQRALGQSRDARVSLERLLALWPEDVRAHAALARELEKTGDWRGAATHHARAAALDPRNAAYAFDHGLAALRARDLTAAVGALREAVRRDPTFAPAAKALGVALLEQGRREEALPHLRRALELAPEMPDAARMRVLLAEDPASPKR
jgi:tetratricopeptide (TPR) repeat protein